MATQSSDGLVFHGAVWCCRQVPMTRGLREVVRPIGVLYPRWTDK